MEKRTKKKSRKASGAPLTSLERQRRQKAREKRLKARQQVKLLKKVQENAMTIDDDFALDAIENVFGKQAASTSSLFAAQREPSVAYLRKQKEHQIARRRGMVRNLLEVFQGSEEREAMVSQIVEKDKDKLVENPSLERYWDLLRLCIKRMAHDRATHREHKALLRQQSVANRKRAALKEAENQRESKSFAGLYNNQSRFNSRQSVILRRNMDTDRFHNRISTASDDKVETLFKRPDPMEDYKRKVINRDFSDPASELMAQHHQPVPQKMGESSQQMSVFEPYAHSSPTTQKPGELIVAFQRMVTSSDLKQPKKKRQTSAFQRPTQLVDPATGLDIRTGLPPEKNYMAIFKKDAAKQQRAKLQIQDGLLPSVSNDFVAK